MTNPYERFKGHTAGPLQMGNKISEHGTFNPNLICKPDGHVVATITGVPLNCSLEEIQDESRWKEALSTGKLFAAAPLLLDDCRDMYDFIYYLARHELGPHGKVARELLSIIETRHKEEAND